MTTSTAKRDIPARQTTLKVRRQLVAHLPSSSPAAQSSEAWMCELLGKISSRFEGHLDDADLGSRLVVQVASKAITRERSAQGASTR
jgi:hypothetical protein